MSARQTRRKAPRGPVERGLGRLVREEAKRAGKRAERERQEGAEIRGYYF